MPTDLEQQLGRFAEALDREAQTISFDDVVGRGTVAVDVGLLEQPSSDRAADDNGVSWIDTTPDLDEISEGDGLIELSPALVARRPAWRRVSLKVALAAAAVAVLVVSVATIERGDEELDAADDFPEMTTTFVSPRNGFSIKHPDGATVTPAIEDGEDGFDVVDTGLAAVFEGTSTEFSGELVVDETHRTVPPDEQIDHYFSDAGIYPGSCGVPRSQQAAITIDGQAGRTAECPNRIEATVLAGDHLYVFILSHERSDARAVFDAFVATIDLTPETTAHFPAMSTAFVSPTYGFSFGHMGRGGLEPATERWDPVNQQFGVDYYQRFDYVEANAGFAGASTEIPEGVSIDAWVDEQVAPMADGCGVPRSEQAEIIIDGRPGRIAECAGRSGAADRFEATVVAGGRLYLFIMLYNGPPDARAWFDAWIATIDLTPGTASVP